MLRPPHVKYHVRITETRLALQYHCITNTDNGHLVISLLGLYNDSYVGEICLIVECGDNSDDDDDIRDGDKSCDADEN